MNRLPLLALAALIATPAAAQSTDSWTVRPEWVRAHEAFLASDALQGRGSATRDEAIAAAYVASQYEGFGLRHAPGMDSYLQTATILQPTLTGAPALTANGKPVADPVLIAGSGEPVSGTLAIARSADPAQLPKADVVMVAAPDASAMTLGRAIRGTGIKLLILKESDDTRKLRQMMGGTPSLPMVLEGGAPAPRASLVVLPAAAFDSLARQPGAAVSLTLPGLTVEKRVTTNAIGYLPGSDPNAGTLLFTAHLDHLGVRPGGTVMHGANDDASGTAAVLEIAHALAAGRQPRRSVLFVCYGSEEIGLYGSRYFGEHSPIPLEQIVANIEIEMIGAQDPKLPAGTMMMTGFDRSTLGEAMKAQGALVTADPYPDEHFFERSDNYSLARKGIVAHTLSGWAVTPTYHQPTDTLENIDIAFMTRAIQSLIGPARWLADGEFTPEWKPGGRPE